MINCKITNYLQEVIFFLKDQTKEKKISINFKYKDDCRDNIKADAIRVQQIFFNLLQNAIKFTKIQKGKIEI